jgi:hypothetical protein
MPATVLRVAASHSPGAAVTQPTFCPGPLDHRTKPRPFEPTLVRDGQSILWCECGIPDSTPNSRHPGCLRGHLSAEWWSPPWLRPNPTHPPRPGPTLEMPWATTSSHRRGDQPRFLHTRQPTPAPAGSHAGCAVWLRFFGRKGCFPATRFPITSMSNNCPPRWTRR